MKKTISEGHHCRAVKLKKYENAIFFGEEKHFQKATVGGNKEPDCLKLVGNCTT